MPVDSIIYLLIINGPVSSLKSTPEGIFSASRTKKKKNHILDSMDDLEDS